MQGNLYLFSGFSFMLRWISSLVFSFLSFRFIRCSTAFCSHSSFQRWGCILNPSRSFPHLAGYVMNHGVDGGSFWLHEWLEIIRMARRVLVVFLVDVKRHLCSLPRHSKRDPVVHFRQHWGDNFMWILLRLASWPDHGKDIIHISYPSSFSIFSCISFFHENFAN